MSWVHGDPRGLDRAVQEASARLNTGLWDTSDESVADFRALMAASVAAASKYGRLQSPVAGNRINLNSDFGSAAFSDEGTWAGVAALLRTPVLLADNTATAGDVATTAGAAGVPSDAVQSLNIGGALGGVLGNLAQNAKDALASIGRTPEEEDLLRYQRSFLATLQVRESAAAQLGRALPWTKEDQALLDALVNRQIAVAQKRGSSSLVDPSNPWGFWEKIAQGIGKGAQNLLDKQFGLAERVLAPAVLWGTILIVIGGMAYAVWELKPWRQSPA